MNANDKEGFKNRRSSRDSLRVTEDSGSDGDSPCAVCSNGIALLAHPLDG